LNSNHLEKTHWNLLQKKPKGGEVEDPEARTPEKPPGCQGRQWSQEKQIRLEPQATLEEFVSL
jgi:hypothetical protein